jgi:hypothetical protein
MNFSQSSLLAPAANWAKQSPSDDFWSFAIILVILTVGGFIGAFYFFLRKRIIEDTPTSSIRSAAQGYVELSGIGKLMVGTTITGPLTGITCTWYLYTIEERRSSGKNSHWVTVEKEISDSLFLLIDDSGEAVIDPEKANVTPSTTDVWYGHSRHPEPRENGNGTKKKKSFFSGMGRYRYTEKRMHPDDPLYAIGLFDTVGGACYEYKTDGDVGHLLREWKKNSEQLLARFDENKDGQIDMEEWQQVRETALKQIQSQHMEQKLTAPVHMLGKTCDTRRPYLLSALPQSDLLKRYSWYSTGLIVTFFVAGILSTWLIGLRLVG